MSTWSLSVRTIRFHLLLLSLSLHILNLNFYDENDENDDNDDSYDEYDDDDDDDDSYDEYDNDDYDDSTHEMRLSQ